MKPICLLSLIFLLSECHSTKKVISNEKSRETSRIAQVIEHTDSVKSDAAKESKSFEKIEKLKSAKQVIRSVTEKYDTAGRVRERTVTVSKSVSQDQKQTAKSDVKTEKKALAVAEVVSTKKTAVTSKKSQSHTQEVKKKRMSLWLQVTLISALGGVLFRTRSSWLPQVIKLGKKLIQLISVI